MRINKLLAERLGISRRKADEFLLKNDVLVNDTMALQGQDITDTDTITINGKALPAKPAYTYVLFNKPVGYVCSRDGQGSATIYDLLPSEYHHLNPVGRLDKDSSGLLLLTNDGDLHQKLTHPSYEKQKQYQVMLDKPLTPNDQALIKKGVLLDDGTSILSLGDGKDNHSWTVTMHEGRNRQIRRTFEALGYRITKLHRTTFGDYQLGTLKNGAWRELTNIAE